MKVLHVTNRIYPEFNGGTEIHVYELCNGLAEAGNKTIILTQTVDREIETIKIRLEKTAKINKYLLCLPVLSTKKRLIHTIIFKNILFLKLFMNVLDKEKPDVVHFHHLFGLSPLLIIICWLRKLPNLLDLVDYYFLCPNLYLTCNGSLSKCAKVCNWKNPNTIREILIQRSGQIWLKNLYGYVKVFFKRLIWRNTLNWSNTVLVPISERSAEIYAKNGFSKNKMVIKPCGIKLRNLPIKKTQSQKIRVGYIGAVIPIKGVKELVLSFRKIKNNKLSLNLYGQNGFRFKELEGLIAGDKRIGTPTVFDHKDLDKILSDVDILIVPSIWEETFGIVVQEALASHTPVIVTKTGGMQERIIDGVNGFVVKPKDIDSLREKLLYVVSQYDSVKSSLDYKIGQYSLVEEIGHVLGLYNSLINRIPLESMVFSKKSKTWVKTIKI